MKLFKNLFLILTLTSVIISCSKDDDVHVPTNSEKTIGNWELKELNTIGTSTTTVGSEDPIEASTVSEGKTFTDSFSKFTHPDIFVSSGSYLLVTTTTVGEEVTEEQKIVQFNASGKWKFIGDKLIITYDGNDVEYEILALTDNILKMKWTNEETVTTGSTVVVTKLTTTFSFEKK